MKSLFATVLLLAPLAATGEGPPLLPRIAEPGVLVLAAADADPCALPLPEHLEAEGRDLFLHLGAPAGPGCDHAEARAALRLELARVVPEASEATGLYRLFLVDAGAPARVLGMNLIDAARSSDWQPESGQWWPERRLGADGAGPGTGLFIEIQAGTLSLVYATYTEDGRAEWLMAAGPLDGRVFRGDLLRFSGGQPPFGSYRAPGAAERVAGIELGFHSPSRAELWLLGDAERDLELQAVPLTRFLFGRPADARAWAGEWLLQGADAASGGEALRFEPVFTLGGGYVLVDAAGELALSCPPHRPGPDTLPQHCTLHRVDSGQVLAEFDGNGLDRLSGRASDGSPVSLIRR
jgi:hypothetical protein